MNDSVVRFGTVYNIVFMGSYASPTIKNYIINNKSRLFLCSSFSLLSFLVCYLMFLIYIKFGNE